MELQVHYIGPIVGPVRSGSTLSKAIIVNFVSLSSQISKLSLYARSEIGMFQSRKVSVCQRTKSSTGRKRSGISQVVDPRFVSQNMYSCPRLRLPCCPALCRPNGGLVSQSRLRSDVGVTLSETVWMAEVVKGSESFSWRKKIAERWWKFGGLEDWL
jgi:hypothetical protein